AGALAVLLVEGQPIQGDAAGPGAVQLLQGDLPLGAVGRRLRDAGGAAARAVVGPLLGQGQVGGAQGLVGAAGEAEVDGDDAVLDLAQAAEVLAGDAGGLGALLADAGLVDQADGAQLVGRQGGQQAGRVPLEVLAQPGEVPGVVAEELLEGAHGCAGGQRDRLDDLSRQVGGESADG